MDRWAPQPYLQEAARRGLAIETGRTALAQAHRVQGRDLPAVLTLNHLAFETGVPYPFLRAAVARKTDPYRTFRIRKRSGGWRHICVPEGPLLRVQRWISDHILRKLPAHHASMAYAPGCSPLACAELHCGCSWLIKIDVRQFFESISEIQVYWVFRQAGYGSLVSFEMARLCTRISGGRRSFGSRAWTVRHRYRYSIEAYDVNRMGHLPQGAATSPILANLSVRELDNRIDQLARQHGLIYSRYSDDMVFSTGFDSAFDAVLYVEYLNLDRAKRLLRRRVFGMQVPFLCLCHCMSGGLPRDLVRVCRQLFDAKGRLQGTPAHISVLAERLVIGDVKAKLRASGIAARRQANTGDMESIVRLIAQIEQAIADPRPNCAKLVQLGKEPVGTKERPGPRPRHGPASSPSDNKDNGDEIRRLETELRAYVYFSVTVLQFFADSLDDTVLREAEARGYVEMLAKAKQAFAESPAACVETVSRFRDAIGIA